MKPTKGRIVLFNEQSNMLALGHGTPMKNRVAIVTMVHDTPDGMTVALTVFRMPGRDELVEVAVPFGLDIDQPGTWHWPPRE